MIPSWSALALKEWAVTLFALEQGSQIILFRKGGIKEISKTFQVLDDGFFLYPTYEHQVAELLKPRFLTALKETRNDEDPDLVTISSFAEVVDIVETDDIQALTNLYDAHIWAPEYLNKRLKWKPRHPISVISLRVHLLEQPQAVPVMPPYFGCKSWVDLVEDFPVGATEPVLSDRQFGHRLKAVKDALGTR